MRIKVFYFKLLARSTRLAALLTQQKHRKPLFTAYNLIMPCRLGNYRVNSRLNALFGFLDFHLYHHLIPS
jgi:hypothetical protein